MKSAQWLAVMVLALMVGGVTFVMVYLGGTPSETDKKEKSTGPVAELTFAQKKYPGEGEMALATEPQQLGHYDFWFHNESGQAVPVGLLVKSCKCTEVELMIAPDSWKPRLLATAAARVLQRAPQTLMDWTVWAATYQPEQVHPALPEEDATTTSLLKKQDSALVPPGAIGWLRLKWRGDKTGPRPLTAELWMGEKGSVAASFVLGVAIAEPIMFDPDVSFGTVNVRELETNKKKVGVYCYSVTRPALRIKAERAAKNLKQESDPFEVGQPEPLSTEQLRKLEEKSKAHVLRFLSGYRIPVFLSARAKDGTPIEMGHFRRLVRLSIDDDESIEPVQVEVSGVVEGDVMVGNAQEPGEIILGPFPSKRGKKGDITLQTDVKNLGLELDKSRVPEYLKARLKGPEETGTGHRTWVLEVEVPPDAAHGDFPRQDDPVYRDSAIYVKTNEKPQRSIRIPVKGAAND
jgi:hypothetical protein